MKIGILTQALRINYGCLMQNYALQQTLEKFGHEVITVDFSLRFRYNSFFRQLLGWLNRMRLYYIHHVSISPCFELRPRECDQFYIAKYTRRWVNKHITTTRDILYFEELEHIDREYDFDAYVVGSDQVFVPMYAPWFMGKFIKRDGVKMFAYAASFGKDRWDLNDQETKETQALVRNFNKISVREDSGLKLCKDYWGVDAVHLIDPTLLLNSDDYLKTIKVERQDKVMFAYVLDESDVKIRIVDAISSSQGLSVAKCMPKAELINGVTKDLNDCIYPPVDRWLNAFNNAEFIVTDSFHGMVFSIIFKKPFLVIGNEQRGMARFVSFLRMFHLENRMVHNVEEAMTRKSEAIDFNNVYRILHAKRQEAMQFLSQIK